MRGLLSILLSFSMALLLVACVSDTVEDKKNEHGPGEVGEVVQKTIPEDIIALNIADLLREQERDIAKAKEAYENRWIELTGKVVSVEHGEYREATRTFMGKTTHLKWGETRYDINGVTIESALIYWLAVNNRFEQADVIVEMNVAFCQNDDRTGYVYYPQHSMVTVVAYCESIGETDIVFTNGRYRE